MIEFAGQEYIKQKEILKIEDFKFSDLPIFFSKKEDVESTISSSFETEYKGEPLVFKAKRMINDERETFFVSLAKNNKNVLDLEFNIEHISSIPVIHSTIVKSFESKDDASLKGLGMKIFESMMNFFQDLADRDGIPFEHEVIKSPMFDIRENLAIGMADSYNNWMTNEEKSNKWDSIFSQFLKDKNYKKEIMKDGDEYWKKIYQPRK